MKTKLITLAALALAFSPNLAFAHSNQPPTARTHLIVAHDRTPHPHDHSPVAHH